MSGEIKQDDYLQLLKNSLYTIKKLKADLEKQKSSKEPIAVIGIGCRLPGGCQTPDAFWDFLVRGEDGIIEVPESRWRTEDFYDSNPEVPGKMYLKEAGFLKENVGKFDARFFGISPREAVEMDPQQRMLLEVSWEALEQAGISPEQIKGTQTGVFIGIIASEYGSLPRDFSKKISPYMSIGSLNNIASGRISYVLGVHGPAISIDTACSSSLVAVHLACESLRKGESNMALAGGVSLMLSPISFTTLCALNALAKDGRCKTFDASGDGYGRSEGCGIVVLKRLSDAIRDKDPILAVIRGNGVNQDGPGSGLTVPNGAAQKELIRKTLEEADVLPSEISYFEAHGTGTSLGDPIEVQALTEVFSKDNNREKPLIIGSVKSNIGHLEAAAGISSLIKVVLSLKNKMIPPNLHLNTINPRINLERIPAVVPTEAIPWETDGKTRIAGISSFGFSGTNAHLIVSEPYEKMSVCENSHPVYKRPYHILSISAKDEKALFELAVKYRDHLEKYGEERLEDICFTANAGRSHFANRLAFCAESSAEMKDKLSEYIRNNSKSEAVERKGSGNVNSKLVFLFNGKFNRKVARTLFETQPLFAKTTRLCDERLLKLINISFLDRILSAEQKTDDIPSNMEEIFAFLFQFCLFKLWESWGVRPNAVLGVKSGEYAAACAAGIMTMETALDYILENEGLMQKNNFEKILSQPKIRVISGSTGAPLEKQEAMSVDYWKNVFKMQPKLERGIEYLCHQGFSHFVEIGEAADCSCKGSIINKSCKYFSSISSVDTWHTLTNTLAGLYCMGFDIDWTGFDRDYDRHKLALPTYPFQRKYFWCDVLPFSTYLNDRAKANKEGEGVGNPLDGKLTNSPMKEKQIEYALSLEKVPDIKDTHGVVHVGYYLELLCRSVKKIYKSTFSIKFIEFITALIVPESGDVKVSLILSPGEGGEIEFSFYSCQNSNNWNKHTYGIIQLNTINMEMPDYAGMRENIEKHCNNEYSGEVFYKNMQDKGFLLGESVKWIDHVWCENGGAMARFKQAQNSAKHGMGIHPGIFDACAQLYHAALHDNAAEDMRYMLVKWEDFVFWDERMKGELWCHVVIEDNSQRNDYLRGIFNLFNENGKLAARISGGLMKGISKERENALKKSLEGAEVLSEEGRESEILIKLKNSSVDKWKELITDYLHRLFSSIFNMRLSEFDINEPLMDIGMDSLVGIEAKTKLEKELCIFLPMEILLQGPSIQQLAEAIMSILNIEKGTNSIMENSVINSGSQSDMSLWIAHREQSPSAKIKLFCFPYGGGKGASLFRGWQKKLPDFIEVCPVQLPGRENRIKEKAFDNMERAVEALEKAISPELDKPYAFYGHSIGALIAYRLAYHLWKKAGNKPKHIFVGAYTSPSILPNPYFALIREQFMEIGFNDIPKPEDMESLTHEQLKKVIGEYSLELDANEELARLILPKIAAEMQIIKSCTSIDEAVFDMPITAIHGAKDDRVKEHEMKAWQDLTKGQFQLHILSGDHFFMSEEQNQEQVLSLLARTLKNYI